MPPHEERTIPQILPPPGPSVYSIGLLPDGTFPPMESFTDSNAPPRLFRDALVVRDAVFLVEQKCNPALEIDFDDGISWHWVIYAENSQGSKVPAATIRLVPAQAHADADDEKAVVGPNYAGSILWDQKEPYTKIGRLSTLKEFRGRGYGRVLVEVALVYAGKNGGAMVKDKELGAWNGLVFVHAQRYLEGWYRGLGFETDKGMGLWWEDGIEHVAMWKRVDLIDP